MTNPIQDDISQVKSLMKERKFKEALALLDMIKAREDLSAEDRLVCTHLESKLRLRMGEFKNALALAEKAVQAALKLDDVLRAAEALSTKAECAWRQGDLDDGLKAVDEGEQLLKGMQFKPADAKAKELRVAKANILRHGGIIHWYKGNLDRAIEYHELSLKISEELGDLRGMADSFSNLGLVYWSKSDLERSVEYHRRSRELFEKTGNRRSLAAALNNLGNVYCMKGELDDALEVYKQSLEIKMEFDLKKEIDTAFINIGSVYRLKGDLDSASDYYQRGLKISEELGAKANIALALNNLGDIYSLRGELGQALEHFQRGLELYQALGYKMDGALTLSNIAEVYWRKENTEQAMKYYQQSLAIYEEIKNEPYATTVLFDLLRVALGREDTALAQQYLERLEQINERRDNKIIDQRYRVAKALSLKAGKRTRHKLEAAKILEKVIAEEVRDHSLAVTAMIHLCDLLLFELKTTGEEELLGEIRELTGQLLEISERQSSHLLLAETYLLQSKLSLVEFDMGQARKLLAQAHSIAEEKGLDRLARVVAQERESLQSHMKKWESLIRQKPSRQEMIDATHIDDLLERMIHETVTGVMEERGIAAEAIPKKKYKLVYLDKLKDPQKVEKHRFRVGIAQIGLSKAGDIIHEFYEEQTPGLFRFRDEIVEDVRFKIKDMVEAASKREIDLLIFPELTIDVSYPQIYEDIISLAKTHNMYLIPGSYHEHKTKQNLSLVVSPDGILWEQAKHIPAMIHFEGTRLTEGIVRRPSPLQTIICSTQFGRVAIVICRDFLDMDLRVALKNAEPPVDLIINPAFTPVTADFKAAHYDARRSIYAYCFFANVAEFGDSFIYTPERERVERSVPAKKEGLIDKEVDLFELRSERKKWEIEHAKRKPFIQSTRQ